MADEKRRGDEQEAGIVQGIAGGPGPTPPGFDDGTPPASPPLENLPQQDAQRKAGEIAERSAGVRRGDVGEGNDGG